MTHEDIERLWNSMSNFIPDRQKSDAPIDFIKTLEDIGVEEDEIKACGEFDPKLQEAVATVFETDDEEQYDDRYDDN